MVVKGLIMDVLVCIGITTAVLLSITVGLRVWFFILCKRWDNVDMSLIDGVFELKCGNKHK